jgi:hypothetical protein
VVMNKETKPKKTPILIYRLHFIDGLTSNYVVFHVPLTMSHESCTFAHGHHELIGRCFNHVFKCNPIGLTCENHFSLEVLNIIKNYFKISQR